MAIPLLPCQGECRSKPPSFYPPSGSFARQFLPRGTILWRRLTRHPFGGCWSGAILRELVVFSSVLHPITEAAGHFTIRVNAPVQLSCVQSKAAVSSNGLELLVISPDPKLLFD